MTSVSIAAATDHLASVHPHVALLRERYGPLRLGRRPGVDRRFHWLAESIAYQQLAGKAAATIWSRVEDALGGDVTPTSILAVGEAPLRAAGLSGNKAASLLDMAERADRGELDLARVGRLDDEQVIDHLVTVRGVGRWTAEMFLIFALRRLDVWPVDDYGVRKGYAALFDHAEPPTPRDLAPLGDPYRPYRTVVTLYCWRAVDTPLPG